MNGKIIKGFALIGSASLGVLMFVIVLAITEYALGVDFHDALALLGFVVAILGGGAIGMSEMKKHAIDRIDMEVDDDVDTD